MTPQQILTALPRQKVKHIPSGAIGEVLCTCQSEFVEFEDHPDDSLMVRYTKTGRNDCWMIEDCEPVPEELRPFRCGDKVVRFSKDDHGGDLKMYAEVTSISVDSLGNRFYEVAGWHTPEKYIRHATPEEEARYFN